MSKKLIAVLAFVSLTVPANAAWMEEAAALIAQDAPGAGPEKIAGQAMKIYDGVAGANPPGVVCGLPNLGASVFPAAAAPEPAGKADTLKPSETAVQFLDVEENAQPEQIARPGAVEPAVKPRRIPPWMHTLHFLPGVLVLSAFFTGIAGAGAAVAVPLALSALGVLLLNSLLNCAGIRLLPTRKELRQGYLD